ncbi:hypothetical protein niasHT_002074 [Heterodera trifolii]|uniref:Uncharacterized protein n=1 Tax=Heterodera trifolii TaxID=157864 RepID=A0ABD2LVF2_9BILA
MPDTVIGASHRTTGWFKNGITAAAAITFMFSQNALIYAHSFKESLQKITDSSVTVKPHLHKSINSPNLCNNSKAACLLFDGCYKLEKLRPPKAAPQQQPSPYSQRRMP